MSQVSVEALRHLARELHRVGENISAANVDKAADEIEWSRVPWSAPVGGVLPSNPLPNCSQCGKPFTDRACGPTHAIIAADPSRYDPTGSVLPSNDNPTYEYRNKVVIPWREADHRNHPAGDHWCQCICEERVLAGCPEHGWQVPRERREVRKSYGEWESV